MKMPFSKKKVALVTYAMHGGGIENFILNLSRYLMESGYEVDVITTEERGSVFDEIEKTGAKGIHLARRGSGSFFNDFFHILRLVRFFQQSHYDVLILNHVRYLQAGLGRISRPKKIIVFHTDSEDFYRVGVSNAAAWDVAVAISPKMVESIRSRLLSKPVVCIPHGVEIPSDAEFKSRKPHSSPLKLIYAGRVIQEQKNVFAIPKILRHLNDRGVDFTFSVAGDGPDRNEFERRLIQEGLQERVAFLGMISPSQVSKVLAEHHVLILPTRYEGLGMILLEAQGAGCVPVCSKLPGVTDFAVEQNVTGFLIDQDDFPQFAIAIESLLDADRWHSMSQAARERAIAHYQINKMGEEYENLIQDSNPPLGRENHKKGPFDFTLFSPLVSLKRDVRGFLGRIKRFLLRPGA